MKKLLKGVALGTVFMLVMLQLAPAKALAQETPKPIIIEPPTEKGFRDIADVIKNLARIIFIIALVLVFFYFLWGGVKWITSGGDKAQTEAARNVLTAALIGFGVIALSYAIIRFIGNFFGVDIFGEFEIPTPPTPVP